MLVTHQDNSSTIQAKLAPFFGWSSKKHGAKPDKFTNPSLAYKVLSQLDGYAPVNGSQHYKPTLKKSYGGFKKDNHYCDKNREHFIKHPESVFDQKNIVHSWGIGTFIQNIIVQIGNDLHSEKVSRMTKKQKGEPKYDLMPSVNGFFTTSSLFPYFKMNEQFSCLAQASSQIPGSARFSRKDLVADQATKYIRNYQERPHCINHEKYFPQTWLLSNISQCRTFFKKLTSVEHEKLQQERGIVYIKKIPTAHRGEGVQPLNKDQEKGLLAKYKNGAMCGKNKKNIVMQQYVHNSLLLKGHKFDFRMYMLIASVNPLMAYYYDGLLRVSLIKYDVNSNDKKVLLTNLVLSEQIHEDAKGGKKFEGMDEEELKNAQQWSFDQLQDYLLEQGIINDPNWLNNYLRPEFKKAMIHLIRLASDGFVRHSSFYGLYGVDFMLDTNLKLWFIEANAGPAFGGYSKSMDKFVSKMIRDHFEVVYGLLRSRMKRVMDFVNNLIEEEQVYEDSDGEVMIRNVEKTRRSFDEITKNYFEKEYEVSGENKFEKIIDENEEGVAMYQGLLEESCL